MCHRNKPLTCIMMTPTVHTPDRSIGFLIIRLAQKQLTKDNSSSGCIILLVEDVDGPDLLLDATVLAADFVVDDVEPASPPALVVFDAAGAADEVVGAAEQAAEGNVGLTGPMAAPPVVLGTPA